MQGKTLLGHQELPRSKTETAATARRLSPQNADRRAAEWVLSIEGKIFIQEYGQERPIGAVGELPRGAFELTVVNLDGNPRVNDAGLAHFKDCKNLTVLFLDFSDFSDFTQVSDAGLAHLKDCKNLTELYLNDTQVSDASLERLTDYPKLGLLLITKTKVTEAGVKKLSAALPECQNAWDGGVIEPKK